MAQVKIGPKFFKNEMRVYRSWTMAFWRENIQNSFDAGSSRIDITVGDEVDGVTSVEIADNGCGMSRETLENVYFNLGETTKSGDSVGGFGKARILTCFAQKKYSLQTNNLLVNGVGSEYQIDILDKPVVGVKLQVDVFSEGYNLKSELERYLSRCHLRGCSVFINGVEWVDWTYRNKHERSLTFGEVFTNKSKSPGILVRVNGVHMFSPYTSAPFLVIIEIDQSKSRSVLQSSRDGLLYQYQNELESFVNELNINKQSALRPKRSKSIQYNGTGTFTSHRSKKMSAEQQVGQFIALMSESGIVLPQDIYNRLEQMSDPAPAIAEIKNKLVSMGHTLAKPKFIAMAEHGSGISDDKYEQNLNFDLFNVVVHDESSAPGVRKVIESYYPQNWDLRGKYGYRYDNKTGETKSFRAGFEKYKLLVMWKAACEFCIRILQDDLQVGGDSISWGVGWCFNDEHNKAEAMYKREGGVNWLLLNPVNSNGNMKFSISDKRSLVKILSIAAHEVCHIAYGHHDELFANLLNNLLEECMFKLNDAIGHIKSAKEDAAKRTEMTLVR